VRGQRFTSLALRVSVPSPARFGPKSWPAICIIVRTAKTFLDVERYPFALSVENFIFFCWHTPILS
jgi:hypothetical protein